jgi:ribosomal protein S18 acetylase RimI-like enzyme
MTANLAESLYRLQKKDVLEASATLADAFRDDPVWKKIFVGVRLDQMQSMFAVPIQYSLRYGQVYATSENLEGLITWVPGSLSNMTIWRLLLSGAIWAGLKGDFRLASKMQPVFRPIEADRKSNMKGNPYLYLPVLGIASQFQGQGFGSKLLKALIAESERTQLPVYLETETENNVRWYGKFGFETVKQITLPIIGLPMWEMVRKPTHALKV